MKCLFVGYDYEDNKVGGGVVSNSNLKVLKEFFGDNLFKFLIGFRENKIDVLKDSILLNANGVTKNSIYIIEQIVKENDISVVFLDSSRFGKIAERLKRTYSNLKIITFFHNIELDYYLKKAKVEGFLSSLVIPSIYYNEKLAVRSSHKTIVLNERDKKRMREIYKTEADTVMPLSLEDRFDKRRMIKSGSETSKYLFVGSAFYANVEGISWFIENVLEGIDGHLTVVGKGMEILKEKYEESEKLTIAGTVDSVDEYYYETDVVVSPIFSGSGMKTKTTEALMFGKNIFGTEEAFEGFNLDFEKVGGCLNSADEFIKKINSQKIENKYNQYSREVFMENYSLETIKTEFKKILEF